MKKIDLQVGPRVIFSISLGLLLGLSSLRSVAEAKNQDKVIELGATLNQDQTVPSVKTKAHGLATVTLNADRTAIGFEVNVSDVVELTKAHIHVGAKGEKGPHIFVLSATSFKSPLSGILQASDLAPQTKQGIATFQDAVDAILNGRAYINVHSLAHPAEEIRGQITKE